MKILHVIPSLSPLRGGPSFAVLTMARLQAKSGLTVEIATTDDDGRGRLRQALAPAPDNDGPVRIRYFKRQTRFYTVSLPLARWLASNVHEFDVVHIHALFSFPSVPAAHYAASNNVPYVVRPLGTLGTWSLENRRPVLKRASIALIERRILDGAAAVHFTSEMERDEARRLGCGERGTVIPLGIDCTRFGDLPPAGRFLSCHPELAGRRIVLYLSRIDPKKGLDVLLPAFAAIHREHPELALVLAGEGESRFVYNLEALAESLGIGGDVVWTGFLRDDDKLAALSAASLFVLPSYSENFGIALVEAMAAGLPVIVCDGVAIAKEIKEYGAGIVVSCDSASLTGGLRIVLQDSETAREMGLKGQKLATERFSADTMVQSINQLYRSLITHDAAGSGLIVEDAGFG